MRNKLSKEYAFLLEELIGEKLKVRKSGSKGLQGLEGTIIDEGRNTFLLHTSKGRKRIPKASCTFLFPPRKTEIAGRLLVAKPEDRTKKLAKDIDLNK